MNHMPTHMLSAAAKPLTRRALAKLRTRQIVLDAAKALITERGYEAATVRDIARRAGMSTGAVFANFADKADLFNAVIIADHEVLTGQMRKAAASKRPALQVLLDVLTLGYQFHIKQLPLLQAAFSLSWTHAHSAEVRNRESQREVVAIAEDILRRGVERGELIADLNIAVVADLVWQSYLANYRHAIFDGWELDDLHDLLARQIGVILAGHKAA